MTSVHSPTLEDVAARAGVGRATVSRVVNGGANVSAAARARIEAAIEELGYVPNHAARSLRTRRTDAVALVIAESEERIFGEPFFAGVVRGIGRALAAADRQLVLLISPSERSERGGEYLSGQHVDGVLLLSLHDDATLPARINARGLPVVIGGGMPMEGAGYVENDNEAGTRAAVEHLLTLGRRRIATITGPLDMLAGRVRLDGYRAALAAAGIEYDAALVEPGDFSQAVGASAMEALLDRAPDLDAVFCANDPTAAGALGVLRERGRRVPEDVAVVGFDDSVIATATRPPLTTVHQSPEEMGSAMVELLVAQLGGAEPGVRVLPTHLVVRGSA